MTDSADILTNVPASMPEIPADRWWIVEFAITNRGPLIGAALRQGLVLPDEVVGDLLDDVALEVAAPYSDTWPRGFDESRNFANREAALFSWIVWRLRRRMLDEARKRDRVAPIDLSANEDLVAVDPIGDRTDLIAATTEYRSFDEGTKRFVAFRENGVSRAAMKAKGFSVRQINNANMQLHSAGRRIASFGPIPAILAFFRRHGAESTATAAGGGTAATAAAVAGSAGSKIVAGCIASVLCAGAIGGGVVVATSGSDSHKAKPERQAAAVAPKSLVSPIPTSKTPTNRSASADHKTHGRAKARHSKSSSSSSTSKSVDNEFGVEAGGGGQTSSPSSSSSSGSSSSSNSSSSGSTEFGVEAGQ